MSTKRPSVTIQSEIIQKYVGSDIDQIAFLDQRISALEAIAAQIPDLDGLIEQLPQLAAFFNSNLYVSAPLLENEVDFAAEGYPAEDTLGAIIAALAIDQQLTQKADRGSIVVADNATQLTPFVYTAPAVSNLPNDSLGVESDATYAPTGKTAFYDSGYDELDLSNFDLGDFITIRVDIDIATSVVNQDVELLLSLGEGTPSVRTELISTRYFQTAAAYNHTAEITFTVDSDDVKDNPGHIQIQSANDASITVNTFKAFINAKS